MILKKAKYTIHKGKDKKSYTISLHMIVRDCKHTLPALFDSITGIFNQIVITDTGSKDGTKEWLVNTYPEIKLYHFEWCYDFSKARNFSLSKVTTDYTMWLDSDDVIEDSKGLKETIRILLENDANGTPYTHAILPYQYATDEHDNASITHSRERILRNPSMWEWREPIHEVCCYVGTEPKDHSLIKEDCIIRHHPVRTESEYSDRNWNILNRDLFENPSTSHRTLYYIQKEAVSRKQYEYAIHIGLILIKNLSDAKSTTGHYFHECCKNLGESFLEMYKKTKDNLYLDKCIEICRIAIDKQPEFNEPRVFLIDALLEARRFNEALDQAEALKVEVPRSLFCTYPINYGTYKYAKLAQISIRNLEDFNSAIHYHLLSKDTEQPCELIYDNEQLINNYMELYNIGLIYSSEKYFSKAISLKQELIDAGIFSGVAITTCVAAVGNARKIYFHLSDDIDSVYMEDGHPHLLKYFYGCLIDNLYPPFGYHQVFKLENFVKDILMSDKTLVVCNSRLEINKTFYRLRNKNDISGSRFVYLGIDDYDFALIEKAERKAGKIIFVIDSNKKLVGILGTYSSLMELNIIANKEGITIYAPDLNKIDWFQVDTDAKPMSVSFTVIVNPKKKLIVFCAGGVEEWDGTTPFKFGIGASESSLVYLAEEMVKAGNEVIVYNTVTSPRNISGVTYLPRSFMGDVPNCDLFVASRMPEALTSRRAKVQALWMHDLPTAYKGRVEDKNVDFYIAVSEWEALLAIDNGFPKDKVIVMPNGLYVIDWERRISAREDGRSIWLSQPERGVYNLINMNKESGLFDKLCVLYGHYNISKFNPDKRQYNSTLVLKKRLRDMGARIMGRLNNLQTREVLYTSDYLAYPSDFPETQCVSVMEAISAGVRVFLNRNGATIDTALSMKSHDLVSIVGEYDKYTKERSSEWCAFMKDRLKTSIDRTVDISNDVLWCSILKRWLLLIEGAYAKV